MISEIDRLVRGKVREGDRFAGGILTELGALEVNAHRDAVDQRRLISAQIGGKVILQEKESVIAKLMGVMDITEKEKGDIIGISQSKPY